MSHPHELVPGFSILEHTADVGLRARGRTLSELFCQMACGLFSVIAEPATISPRTHRPVSIACGEGAPLRALLHDWLEELNSLHQIHGELYCEFEAAVDPGLGSVSGRARGEAIDPPRHRAHLEVKAVTWHGLEVVAVEGGFEATVLLDI